MIFRNYMKYQITLLIGILFGIVVHYGYEQYREMQALKIIHYAHFQQTLRPDPKTELLRFYYMDNAHSIDISMDGKVQLPPNMKPDAAARLFWAALEHARIMEPPSGYYKYPPAVEVHGNPAKVEPDFSAPCVLDGYANDATYRSTRTNP